MHHGKSRGKQNRPTRKVCKKTRNFYETRGKFWKVGEETNFPEMN